MEWVDILMNERTVSSLGVRLKMLGNMAFDEVSVAEARNRFSELTRKVTDRTRLVRVKRQKAGQGKVYWIPEEVWSQLLKFIKFKTVVRQDEVTGLWEVIERNLSVTGTGETREEAVEDFLGTLVVSAEDFFENIDFYMRHKNLARRLPYYLKFASAGTLEEAKSLLGL